MLNRLALALLVTLGIFSCGKTIDPTGFKEYIIPKGSHSATENGYKVVNKSEMRFLALFDSSCIYTAIDPKNFTDINKLYGFSDCGSLHQDNSARVGWVWNGQAIELHAYCYKDKVRQSTLIGTVKINEPCELSIKAMPGKYVFTLNNTTTITMDRSCTSAGIAGYQLYPYFGGDEVAPHDVHIYIKDL